MLTAFLLSVGQLGDRAILWVLAKSLALTLLLFAGLGYAIHAWLGSLDQCLTVAEAEFCTVDIGLSSVGTVLLVLAALWLLFPAIAIGVIGSFSEEIVAAVERRHYPEAAGTARALGWGRGLAMGLRSGLRLFGYNLLALPFYILLIVTGVGPFVLALVVNGVALGRDLWEMVAVRHLPSVAIKPELGESRTRRFGVGLATAGLFVVPVANLLAPVLGAAMATHMYHRRVR